ncbi:hypothetical protein GQ457_02G023530 [Hibiscus cannabinus]
MHFSSLNIILVNLIIFTFDWFFHDAVLAKVLEEATTANFNSIIQSNNAIVNSILTEDIKFIQELFVRLRSPATSTDSKKILIIVDIWVKFLCDVDDPNDASHPINTENVTDTSLPQAVDNASHLNSESSTENKLFSTQKINVTLDDQNYLLWHQHVYLTIKTHRLLKFIDSSDQTPPKYVTRNGVVCINPEFELFEEHDGALATWLLYTVSQSVLSHLIGLNTASGIWHTLHRLYNSKTTSRLMSYRRLLHYQKKGDLSMQEFLMKIKSLCDNLANSGERIPEHEHKTAILNGLPPEYDPMITVITASPTSYDLTFVSTILMYVDVRQHNIFINAYAHFTSHLPIQNVVTEFSHDVLNSTQNTTFDSTQNQGSVHTSSYSQSGQTGYNSSNRGRGCGKYSNRPQCQLCGRLGHLVDRCYYRFDMNFKNNEVMSVVYYTSTPNVNPVTNYYQRNSQLPVHDFSQLSTLRPSSVASFSAHVLQSQPQIVHAASHVSSNPTVFAGTAMYPPPHVVFSHVQPPVSTPQVHLATYEIMDDNVWFPDSGATHHLTNDYNNLQDGSALPGSGSVQVGNGHTLPIKYFGQSNLVSNSKNFLLKNLLYVPSITKNLLSVSKLTQDNQVSLEFFPNHCQVKDLHTKCVLLEGHESGGLYKLAAFSNKDKNGFLTQANTMSVGSDKAGVNTQPISSFCKLPVTNNVPLQIWHNRLGKSHKLPFSHSHTEYSSLLDLVVADV